VFFSGQWQIFGQPPGIAVLFQLMRASSASSLSIERRFRATMWAKVPQTKAGIADFNQRWWTELGSP
jgi:hypothetical protein